MNYGNRLKALRLERGLKQSDIAAILNVSSSSIGAYERCERQPTYELLLQFSSLFNVSVDYLLCNSDERLTIEASRMYETIELADLLKYSTTLHGIELTEADKQRILDIAAVLLFDRLQ